MTTSPMTWNLPLFCKPTLMHAALGCPTAGESRFHLPATWCAYLFLPPWKGESDINGVPCPFEPRYFVLVPPGARQRYRFFAASRHLYAHFRMASSEEGVVEVPAAQQLEDDFEVVRRAFEKVIGFFSTSIRRAEVHFWDMLWNIAFRGQASSALPRGESLLDHVRYKIELDLGRSLRVADLAADAGISSTHLARLFRASMDMTAIEYIRDCRVRRAQYLLTATTLPIKAVAHEVGIPDLQHFNKTIRRALGCSPRQWRIRKRGG